jgi:hypothetical protein
MLYTIPMSTADRARRLREARIACGFPTALAAAKAFRWNLNTYTANENGNAPYSFRSAKAYGDAYGVRGAWLYDGALPRTETGADQREDRLTRIVGRVGADPEGLVLFAMGQDAGDLVPLPPGGTERAVALRVAGHSMRGLVDDGGLIYFEDQRTPPTPDMLGHVVVVETDADEVLVKRLLRGARAGRYDLESIAGPTRRDCKLRWAAHITAIIPPFQARRIIRMSGA